MRFFFPRADRLLKRPEFYKLSTFGNKVQNRHFIATFAPGCFKRTRLGITVTKKVGHAVTRNRIKRLSREHFRQNKHIITGNWDINIIARHEAAELSSNKAFLSLRNIFDKISRSINH